MIGNDSEGHLLDDMLEGSFKLDTKELNEVSALSEVRSFIAALRTPLSTKIGDVAPEMSAKMEWKDTLRPSKKQGSNSIFPIWDALQTLHCCV